MIKSPKRYAASSASHRPNTATAVHREDILPKRKAFGQMWTWRNLKLLEPRILSKIDTFLDSMGQQDELADKADDWWSAPQNLVEACIHLTMDITSELTCSACTNMQTSSKNRWLSDAFMTASWRGMTVSTSLTPNNET